MKMHFTKESVQNLQPKDKRYTVTATNIKGLAVKVSPNGSKVFYLITRIEKGKGPTSYKLGNFHGTDSITIHEAETEIIKYFKNIRSGEPIQQVRNEKRLLSELFDDFFTDYVYKNLKTNSIKSMHYGRKLALEQLTNKKFVNVTTGDIEKAYTDIKKKGISRANKMLNTIKSFYTWCQKKNYVKENIAHGIKNEPEKLIDVFLTKDDFKKIISSLNKLYESAKIDFISKSAIELLMLTGVRHSEIIGIQHKDIKLGEGLVYLSDSKTGSRYIYLSSEAKQIVEKLQEFTSHSIWLFPSPRLAGRHLYTVWPQLKKVYAHAGLGEITKDKTGRTYYKSDWNVHSLRHMFCSHYVQNGGTYEHLMKIVGHKDFKSTDRYTHQGPEARDHLESYGPKLQNIDE